MQSRKMVFFNDNPVNEFEYPHSMVFYLKREVGFMEYCLYYQRFNLNNDYCQDKW